MKYKPYIFAALVLFGITSLFLALLIMSGDWLFVLLSVFLIPMGPGVMKRMKKKIGLMEKRLAKKDADYLKYVNNDIFIRVLGYLWIVFSFAALWIFRERLKL